MVVALLGALVAAVYWARVFSPHPGLEEYVSALANSGLALCLLLRNVYPLPVALAAAGLLTMASANAWVSDGNVSVTPLLVVGPLVVIALVRRPGSRLIGVVALGIGVIGSAASPAVRVSGFPVWSLSAHVVVLVGAFVWATWREQERQAQTRAALARADLARVDERNRLSAELHDLLGHSLAIIHVHANAEIAGSRSRGEKANPAFEVIKATARTSLRDVRALVSTLREDTPPAATDLGAALHGAIDRYRRVDMVVDANLPDEAELASWSARVPGVVVLTVVRCVQEGLANALRHGDSDADVVLDLRTRPGGVRLRIVNRVSSARSGTWDLTGGGLGLVGVTERVESVGGTVRATREAGEHVLDVWVPDRPGDRAR